MFLSSFFFNEVGCLCVSSRVHIPKEPFCHEDFPLMVALLEESPRLRLSHQRASKVSAVAQLGLSG